MERIGDRRVIPYTLGVSGTMKAAKRKFFGERTLEDFSSEEKKVSTHETGSLKSPERVDKVSPVQKQKELDDF